MKYYKSIVFATTLAVIGSAVFLASRSHLTPSTTTIVEPVEVIPPPVERHDQEVYAPIRRASVTPVGHKVSEQQQVVSSATSFVPSGIPEKWKIQAVANYYKAWNAVMVDTNAFPAMEALTIPEVSPAEAEVFMEAMTVSAESMMARIEQGEVSRQALGQATMELNAEFARSYPRGELQRFSAWNRINAQTFASGR
ncbi:MAG: hypothetical protein Q7R78_00400 [bacterium]|nr:hypothetical protein [bacterium]